MLYGGFFLVSTNDLLCNYNLCVPLYNNVEIEKNELKELPFNDDVFLKSSYIIIVCSLKVLHPPTRFSHYAGF